MPRIERSADVVWEGNVARGDGHLTAETGAFNELPFSLPSRIARARARRAPRSCSRLRTPAA